MCAKSYHTRSFSWSARSWALAWSLSLLFALLVTLPAQTQTAPLDWQSRLMAIENRLLSVQRELNDCQTLLSLRESTSPDYERQIAELQKTRNDLEQRIKNYEQIATDLQEKNSSSETTISSLESRTQILQQESGELRKMLQEQSKRFDDYARTRDQADRELMTERDRAILASSIWKAVGISGIVGTAIAIILTILILFGVV